MTSCLSRILQFCGFLVFAIIGTMSLFTPFGWFTPQRGTNSGYNEHDYQHFTELEFELGDVDVPGPREPTKRVELNGLGSFNQAGFNTVSCWPSVGSTIINDHVSSVELEVLKLSRFETSPRSFNVSEEDEFCHQLRKTGGMWWEHYGSFYEARNGHRRTSPRERQAVVLGWPKAGGVWVLTSSTSWDLFGAYVEGFYRIFNAHNMEERCKAMEMVGAKYFEDPDSHESVKELLAGFGEHERDEDSVYTYE